VIIVKLLGKKFKYSQGVSQKKSPQDKTEKEQEEGGKKAKTGGITPLFGSR